MYVDGVLRNKVSERRTFKWVDLMMLKYGGRRYKFKEFELSGYVKVNDLEGIPI